MKSSLLGIVILVFSLVLASSTAMTQPMADLGAMRDYFKDRIDGKPYTLLQTPRSGLGLGSVYTNFRGQSLTYATPEDCFSSDVLGKFETLDVTLPQTNSESSYTWQTGLKVAAAGAVTSELQAEFDRKRVKNMVLTLPSATREYWSIRQLKDIITTKTSDACKQDLTRSDPERWIVYDLVSSKSMKIAFKQEGGTNASLSVGLLKLLFPSAKYDSSQSVTGELSFDGVRRIIAVKMAKITDIPKMSSTSEGYSAVSPQSYYAITDKR